MWNICFYKFDIFLLAVLCSAHVLHGHYHNGIFAVKIKKFVFKKYKSTFLFEMSLLQPSLFLSLSPVLAFSISNRWSNKDLSWKHHAMWRVFFNVVPLWKRVSILIAFWIWLFQRPLSSFLLDSTGNGLVVFQ